MRLHLGIGIACLPLLVPACFSSTQTDDTEAVYDAGSQALDATVPLEASPEAATPEGAAPEAAAPDAGPQPVTVAVTTDRGPEQGVTVVFQDSSGAVLATAITDLSGKAAQVVPAGSQVTAVMGTPQNVQLVTVEAVAPGDVLLAHDATDTTLSSASVSIDALPDATPPDGTQYYFVQIGNCSGEISTLPWVGQIGPECENGGAFPVLVQAVGYDGQDREVTLGFLYQNDNTVSPDGGTTHITLSGQWSTALTTQLINVTNASGLYAYAEFNQIADGVAYGASSYVEPDDDGGGAAQFTGYAGYPTSIQNEVNVSANRGPNLSVSAIATRGTPSLDGGAASFDLSTLLPLLDDVTLDASQPAQPAVSWVTEAGSLAGANGAIVALAWSGSNDAGSVTGTWTFVAPPTATSVVAPALPAAVAAFAPSADSTFSQTPNVIVVQGSFLASYADLRSRFAALPVTSGVINATFTETGVVPPLPVDGTLRLTAITYNAD
jgi:hypothetical protein